MDIVGIVVRYGRYTETPGHTTTMGRLVLRERGVETECDLDTGCGGGILNQPRCVLLRGVGRE